MKSASLRCLSTLLFLLWLSAALAPVEAAPIKIMAMGDSITAGMPGNGYYTYRDELYDLLTREGYEFDFVGSQTSGNFKDNQHEGYSGYTTSALLAKPAGGGDNIVKQAVTTYAPDVVLLHIGTNDLLGGVEVQDASNNTFTIVNTILSLNSQTKVILAQIIGFNDVRSTFNDNQRERITYFNEKLALGLSAYQKGDWAGRLKLVDMYTALTYDFLAGAGKHFMDTTHPNATGSDLMAARWFAALNDPNFLAFSQKPPAATHAPAPLPALLLGSGLAGLAFLRRRRGRSDSTPHR